MKTIGIVGSRRRNTSADFARVRGALMTLLEPGDRLVSGGCPTGADRFAEVIARDLGLTITIHFADWTKHRKAAGFIRNTRIAEDADKLIACVAEDRSGGTEDTITKFLAMHDETDLILV